MAGPAGSEEAVSADMAELAKEIRALQADVAALATTVKSLGLHEAEAVADAVRSKINDASLSAKSTVDEVRRCGERAAEKLDSSIARHPNGAVLLAAGIGFFVGSMMRR
jgi:ElaB/YqjD/DUF883 family membrane-anchored ribosome-binding protein